MILTSIQTLDFTVDQKIQSFTITNPKQSPILFKVKTNNINAIDAKPFAGCLQPKSNTKITVKRNGNINQQIKILIGYTQCPQQLTKQNFKQLWNKYSKNQKSEIITIRVIKKEENKEQKQQKQMSNDLQQQKQKENRLYMSLRKQPEKVKEQQFFSKLMIQEKQSMDDVVQSQAKQQQKKPLLQKQPQQEEKTKQEMKIIQEKKIVQQKKIIQEKKITQEKKIQDIPKTKIDNVGNKFQISPLILVILISLVFSVGYFTGKYI